MKFNNIPESMRKIQAFCNQQNAVYYSPAIVQWNKIQSLIPMNEHKVSQYCMSSKNAIRINEQIRAVIPTLNLSNDVISSLSELKSTINTSENPEKFVQETFQVPEESADVIFTVIDGVQPLETETEIESKTNTSKHSRIPLNSALIAFYAKNIAQILIAVVTILNALRPSNNQSFSDSLESLLEVAGMLFALYDSYKG